KELDLDLIPLTQTTLNLTNTSKNKDTCHLCKQTGHFTREWPNKKNRINNLDLDIDEFQSNGDDTPADDKSL
ncbi:hypothetical protein VP01_4341g2, partial [Puccinia sorghi]